MQKSQWPEGDLFPPLLSLPGATAGGTLWSAHSGGLPHHTSKWFLTYNLFLRTGLAHRSSQASGLKHLASNWADHIFWIWQKELILVYGTTIRYVWSLSKNDSFFRGFKHNSVYVEQSTQAKSLVKNVIDLIVLGVSVSAWNFRTTAPKGVQKHFASKAHLHIKFNMIET